MTPQEEVTNAINEAGGTIAYSDLAEAVQDSTKRRLLDVVRDLERDGQAHRVVSVVDGTTVFNIVAGAKPVQSGA